jgi:serine-type D-Ala-D-Ala carboxypeptidase/endopeptidase (penicillin-binding protein 4)
MIAVGFGRQVRREPRRTLPRRSFRRPICAAAAAAGLALLAGGAPPAGASAARIAAEASLAASLAREVDAAGGAAREIGVHVVDLAAGVEIFGHQADRPRILASNAKLLTTAAALAELGPEYRFETQILVRGEVGDGVLRGDVAVVGSGDPNLSGRFHDGDSFAPFRPWARELAARGVRRVEGDLVLVNGLFDEPRVHPDWPRDQLVAWYEAPIDALSFNDNCVLVRVRPGARPGSPARVETVPAMDYFRFRNTARTAESGRGRLVVTREATADTLVVSGWIGSGARPVDVWVAVYDPPAYFAAALRAAFAEEGVELPARFRYEHAPLPGVWELLAAHSSDLPATLAVTNKRSQNLYAESLAKLLGWKKHGTGSWETASRAIESFLAELGLPAAEISVADGSGLSRGNQASPRALTGLLAKMYFHPYGREFLQSLPYSGEGELTSWRRRLATPPYRGNVFAKTGTLRGVSTLSGYAKARSGRVYAFSILLNQSRGNGVAHAAQDRIVRALVDQG